MVNPSLGGASSAWPRGDPSAHSVYQSMPTVALHTLFLCGILGFQFLWIERAGILTAWATPQVASDGFQGVTCQVPEPQTGLYGLTLPRQMKETFSTRATSAVTRGSLCVCMCMSLRVFVCLQVHRHVYAHMFRTQETTSSAGCHSSDSILSSCFLFL